MTNSEAGPSRSWTEFTADEAQHLDLSVRTDIRAPVNQEREPCPWPWEPETRHFLVGQYKCNYCGAWVIAGVRHPNYIRS